MNNRTSLQRINDARFQRLRDDIDQNQTDIDELEELSEVSGVAFTVPPYAFADLPTVPSGFRLAICTDGLDVGETTGNGTGVLVIYKQNGGSGAGWYRVADNTTVAN